MHLQEQKIHLLFLLLVNLFLMSFLILFSVSCAAVGLKSF